MGHDYRLSGVLAPVITPFADNLEPDAALLAAHCRWLLTQGAGLAVFGTNSEANSLSVDEKIMLLEHLVESGIDNTRLLPGTGCCALTDTVTLTRRAVDLDCAGVLMLPPFYYKDVSDDGLFRSFSEVVQRVGSDRLRIYLYHIPPIAQVGISPPLVERLVNAYPGIFVGIKDSSGDWANTNTLLEMQLDDFRVFAGSETFLLRNMRGGGAGCISATANINPGPIHTLYTSWQTGEAEQMQSGLDGLRELMQRYPMIAALKAVVAHYTGKPVWRNVRPPLLPLAETGQTSLMAELERRGFVMPGI